MQRAEIKSLREQIAEEKDLLLTMQQREEIKLLREQLAEEKDLRLMTMQQHKALQRKSEVMLYEFQKRGAPHCHTMGSH